MNQKNDLKSSLILNLQKGHVKLLKLSPKGGKKKMINQLVEHYLMGLNIKLFKSKWDQYKVDLFDQSYDHYMYKVYM